jgi:DNA-binding winged helix-turn-helix (wHTH) protein/TolB-like protein
MRGMLAFPPPKSLRFDVFSLDLSRCILLRGEVEIPLRRQSYDVLLHLAEKAGQVVSRDELNRTVWPGVNVTDDSLAQCIKDIRQALGEEARWMVRTVSGRGYVFMPEVTTVAASPSEAAPSARARAAWISRPGFHIAIGVAFLIAVSAAWWLAEERSREPAVEMTMMARPSLAVLRFELTRSNPAEADSARALSDDVTTEISRQLSARMIALKSADGFASGMSPRDAGAQLGARYLLIGSVRRDENDIHANVRLIEAETGRQLWAQPFQYRAAEHRRTVVRIASLLGLRLTQIESQRPLPEQPEAAHYNIMGTAILTNERDEVANDQARALFEKAISLNPSFVPALTSYALTEITSVQYGWAPPNEIKSRLDKAEEAVERAIKVAPRNALAYYRRAQLLRARGDIEGAIAAADHALTMNPNFAPVIADRGRNKIDLGLAHEAIPQIEEAIQLGPEHHSVFMWSYWAGQAAVHLGQYEEAVRWLQKSRQADPGFPLPAVWLAIAYSGLGREAEARDLLRDYFGAGHHLSIAAWNKRLPPGEGVVREQRARIIDIIRRLGVPEGGETQAGSSK